MTPSKLPRSVSVAINRRHKSQKQKIMIFDAVKKRVERRQPVTVLRQRPRQWTERRVGTHVRLLEADKPAPQPRDDAGRYVSKVEITRQRLARCVSRLTPEEAEAARMRGMGGGR